MGVQDTDKCPCTQSKLFSALRLSESSLKVAFIECESQVVSLCDITCELMNSYKS